ncbi:MAG: DUF1801 domain-containing protein [Bacteroidetes bacterium]|nr:DUF1801 domain-containing protein [Bacteroidota bacterium]
MKSSKPTKPGDAESVEAFMASLEHPYKAELEALRKMIKAADKRLQERIKWNAPSYYYKEDLVTFGPMRQHKIMLVFHHPYIVHIKSPLLEGNYKDRRLVYFADMKAVKAAKPELTRILKELLETIDV